MKPAFVAAECDAALHNLEIAFAGTWE